MKLSVKRIDCDIFINMKSEWTSLGLSKPILQTLKELKFNKMTPVQVRYQNSN